MQNQPYGEAHHPQVIGKCRVGLARHRHTLTDACRAEVHHHVANHGIFVENPDAEWHHHQVPNQSVVL